MSTRLREPGDACHAGRHALLSSAGRAGGCRSRFSSGLPRPAERGRCGIRLCRNRCLVSLPRPPAARRCKGRSSDEPAERPDGGGHPGGRKCQRSSSGTTCTRTPETRHAQPHPYAWQVGDKPERSRYPPIRPSMRASRWRRGARATPARQPVALAVVLPLIWYGWRILVHASPDSPSTLRCEASCDFPQARH